MLNYENIKQYLPTDLSENIINQINSLEFFPAKPRYDITGQKFNQLIVLGKGPNIQTGKRSFG